jgi:hypothetical protein
MATVRQADPRCKHCHAPAVLVAEGQVRCLECGKEQEETHVDSY